MKLNIPGRFLTIIVILPTLLSYQQFEKIKVERYNNQIIFNLEDIGKDIDGNRQFLLFDISVSKDNCNANCVIWEMVRKEEIFDSNDYPLKNGKIAYGTSFTAMKTSIQPEALAAGKHTVVGNVGLVVDGQFVRTVP